MKKSDFMRDSLKNLILTFAYPTKNQNIQISEETAGVVK